MFGRADSPIEEISCVRRAAEIMQARMNGRTRSCDVRRVAITLTLTPQTAEELFDDDIVPPPVREVILQRTVVLELGDGLDMRQLPDHFLDRLPNMKAVKLYEASHHSDCRWFGEMLRPCDCHTGGVHYYPRPIQNVVYEFKDLGNDDDEGPALSTNRSQACLLASSPRAENVEVTLAVWGQHTARALDEWLVQQPLQSLSIGFKEQTCINSHDNKWGYFGDHIFRAEHADRCPQTSAMDLVELRNVDFTHAKQQFEDFWRQASQVPRLQTLRLHECRVPFEYWWGLFHEFYGMRVTNLDLSRTVLGPQGAFALWKALPSMHGLKYLNVSLCMSEDCEEDLYARIHDQNLDVTLEGTNTIYGPGV